MITDLWGVMRNGSLVRQAGGDDARREIGRAWLFFDNEDDARLAAWFIKRVDQLKRALDNELVQVLDPEGAGKHTMKALEVDPVAGLTAFAHGFAKQVAEDLEQESRDEIMRALGRQG